MRRALDLSGAVRRRGTDCAHRRQTAAGARRSPIGVILVFPRVVLVVRAVAPDGTIFVASIGTGKSPTTGATSGTEIAVFGKTANGNVAPDRIIDVTALATPSGLGVFPGALAADASDTVYLGDQANADDVANGIYAFSASGALTAHIATSSNGLGWVTGLAIDASGDLVVQSVGIPGHAGQTALFVCSTAGGLTGPTKTIPNGTAVPGIARSRIAVNAAGDVYELSGELNAAFTEVYEFSLNGTSGSPIGSFNDNQTNFDDQTAIAVDAAGRIYVTSFTLNTAFVYAAGTSGSNVSPITSYSDYAASTLNVRGVTFGADGKTLYATSCDTDSVSVYPSGASSASRSIVGTNTKLLCPFAVAVDASGTMYVEDGSGLSVFAASASGNVAPIRQITYLQNLAVNGFDGEDIALGPGPIGSANVSASHRATRATGRGLRPAARAARRRVGRRGTTAERAARSRRTSDVRCWRSCFPPATRSRNHGSEARCAGERLSGSLLNGVPLTNARSVRRAGAGSNLTEE